MRLIFILLLIVVGLIPEAAAQSTRIDSLRRLTREYRGEKQVDALNEYAVAIFSYDYLKARGATREAYRLAMELKYQKGSALALLNEGNIESSIGNDTLSMRLFQRSLRTCQEAKDKRLEGRVRIYIGLTYQRFERLDSAEVYYNRAYRILKDSTNPLYLSFLYLNLASFYKDKNNQTLQLSYLLRSWNIRKKLGQKRPFVWIGIQLASYYTEQGNYKESLSYLNQIQQSLGGDTLDNEEINNIHKEKAIILAKHGNFRSALDLFVKAKKFYDRNAYPLDQTNLFIEMGYALADVSNYETSLKYFLKALDLAQSNHYHRETSRLYFHVAWIYFELNQNSLSEEYCAKAIKITRDHHYEREESSTLNLLGLLAQRKNKLQDAMGYFNEALALRTKNNYRDMQASTLSNMAILFLDRNDFKKAEELELKSLAIDKELSHPFGICESYKNLGQLYTRKNDFKTASAYLAKAEVLAKSIHAANFLSTIYDSQRELFRKQLNYSEAYRYSILYESIKDSLFNQSLTNRVSTVQYDFELDQKDKEIKILGQQKELQQDNLELQQAQIKQQKFIIAVGLFVFLNICVGGYISFRFYRRVGKLNREISEQNEILSKLNDRISKQKEEIQAQAEELTRNNYTILLANESLEEKIRARTTELKEAYTELDTFFYRSSHDFRRPLTTFMGLAEVAKITLKESAALELFEKVNDTARSLDKMLLKLQSISAAGTQELIYSEVMMNNIFQIELDNFREEIIQKSIRILQDVKLTQAFFSYPALVKFIVQNLLENAVTFHSQENPAIWLKAYEGNDEVVIEVADNGEGINPTYRSRVFEMYFRANERSKGNGLGLYIVKKMVDKLSGRIELKSEVGLGTTIRVFLPNQSNQ
jgi:signal transduction histidine kinase